MNNQNVLFHNIVPGDTLYSIAKRYNTTIDTIMDANPYLDPQRLRIGDQIVIYTRTKDFDVKITKEALLLMTKMRSLIDDLIVWNHAYIVSSTGNLMDISSIDQKQLRTINEIGNLFEKYYGPEFKDKLIELLKQHDLYINELIKAMIRGDGNAVNNYERRLRTNNDDIAFTIDQINPYYNENTILNHLYFEIDIIEKMTMARLAHDYASEISGVENLREQGVAFADYLTDGIIEQFPNRFR